jgi:hypothetical protein
MPSRQIWGSHAADEDVTPSSLVINPRCVAYCSILKMETVLYFKISVIYRTTRRHILGNDTLQNVNSLFGSVAVIEMEHDAD